MSALTAATTTTSRRRWDFDVLRVVSVIGVVAIHVFADIVANADVRGTADWWGAVVADIGFIWVVPVFVMLSGALILDPRQHSAGPAGFYRRRLVRLAPALVAWSLFYFLIVQTGMTGRPLTRLSAASFVLDGRPYTHLYFLWLILGLYAIAPVLSAFLRGGGNRRALVFAGCVLGATVVTGISSSVMGALGSGRPLTLMAMTQWLPYVGFFLAGWALRDVVLRGARLVSALVLTIALVAVTVVQYGLELGVLDAVMPVSYYGPVVSATCLGVFVCSNGLLSRWRPGRRMQRLIVELSDSAFGVFLVHFVIMLIVRAVPVFASSAVSFPLSAAVWVLVVVASLGLVFVMRRTPGLRRLV